MHYRILTQWKAKSKLCVASLQNSIDALSSSSSYADSMDSFDSLSLSLSLYPSQLAIVPDRSSLQHSVSANWLTMSMYRSPLEKVANKFVSVSSADGL